MHSARRSVTKSLAPFAVVGAVIGALLVACGSDASGPAAGALDDASAADAAQPGFDSGVDGGSVTNDAASPNDATRNDAPSTTSCGEFSGDTRFTCSKDGNSRGKCVGDASLVQESCANGCLREKPPADDVCMGTTAMFTCTGSYATTPVQNGDYYLTAFGCWVDANGGVQTDPQDNCIPSCLAQAKAKGLCLPGDTGPQCEERVDWYTADGARFGCLARLRVTNPKTGKSLIAVALDFGPSYAARAAPVGDFFRCARGGWPGCLGPHGGAVAACGARGSRASALGAAVGAEALPGHPPRAQRKKSLREIRSGKT